MKYKLKDLVTIKYGKNQKLVEDNINGKIPILGTGGVIGYAKESLYNKPSVLIGRKGTIDKIRYVDQPFWTIDTLFYTEINTDIVIPQYLYYRLLDIDFKNLNEGTTIPSLRTQTLYEIELEIEDIKTQNKIVDILSTIDKKIKYNTHTNNNLLQLGDLIYNNFFISPKDEWHIKTLKEISNNFDSKRKPMSSREREEHKGTYPYYGATSIIDYVDNYLFDDTYILMGEDGTVITDDNKPVLQYIWGKFWANNHAHVLQGSIISNEYLYFALRNTDVKSLVTGAVQPKINQENMNKLKFIIPDQDNLRILEKSLSILMKKYKENCCKISTLEQIRDTLLPKLMNGEIDLDKIEI